MRLRTILTEANSSAQMYDMNLTRLMDASAVKIDDEVYDELADYLTEIDSDLNSINIDDLVVNSLQYLEADEVKDLDEDDYMVLKKIKGDGWWVLN